MCAPYYGRHGRPGLRVGIEEPAQGASRMLTKRERPDRRGLPDTASIDGQLEVPALDRGSPVEDVIRAAIGSGAARLIDNDPGVRVAADPEAIHQARVATRRLRSDLKTLEPLLSEERVAWLRDELAWIGGALGNVRDADVLTSRIGDAGNRLQGPSAWVARVAECVQDDRSTAHAELIDALESPRYLSLVEALV